MGFQDKKKILLAYFSGTGGTKRIVETFENQLLKNRHSVLSYPIEGSFASTMKTEQTRIVESIDLLILFFAVHAFNAPLPVKNWIKTLPHVNNIDASVISVSGGGESSFNKVSRGESIKALEKKGFRVFYETMMIMPSNWVIPTPDHIAIRLIRCLPKKAETITDDILSGKTKRTKTNPVARFIASGISHLEQKGTKKFGKGLRILDTCTQCLWCVKHCPMGNISFGDEGITFGEKCIICFRCIYGCPSSSIHATRANFMVLKQGYDPDQLEKRMDQVELLPLEVCAKGFLWKAVKSYLSD
ncbi:MAG: EFR1 family ferrodoxin [Spirochaetales bacterium]|nr:EFR1 family ferrodoxin [Spirochaetales bacterium]